jgi:hypothetical protein
VFILDMPFQYLYILVLSIYRLGGKNGRDVL